MKENHKIWLTAIVLCLPIFLLIVPSDREKRPISNALQTSSNPLKRRKVTKKNHQASAKETKTFLSYKIEDWFIIIGCCIGLGISALSVFDRFNTLFPNNSSPTEERVTTEEKVLMACKLKDAERAWKEEEKVCKEAKREWNDILAKQSSITYNIIGINFLIGRKEDDIKKLEDIKKHYTDGELTQLQEKLTKLKENASKLKDKACKQMNQNKMINIQCAFFNEESEFSDIRDELKKDLRNESLDENVKKAIEALKEAMEVLDKEENTPMSRVVPLGKPKKESSNESSEEKVNLLKTKVMTQVEQVKNALRQSNHYPLYKDYKNNLDLYTDKLKPQSSQTEKKYNELKKKLDDNPKDELERKIQQLEKENRVSETKIENLEKQKSKVSDEVTQKKQDYDEKKALSQEKYRTYFDLFLQQEQKRRNWPALTQYVNARNSGASLNEKQKALAAKYERHILDHGKDISLIQHLVNFRFSKCFILFGITHKMVDLKSNLSVRYWVL